MDALVALIDDIKAARASGATDAQLEVPRQYQRRGQFYLDFVEAENSMGFHAPEEAARVLADSMNYTRLGQIALRDALAGKPVRPPSDPSPTNLDPLKSAALRERPAPPPASR